MEMNKYETILQVQAANLAHGGHWFTPDTMRYFGSRLHGVLGSGRLAANRYFISSERTGPRPDATRAFTVRMVTIFDGIETVGDFNGYKTKERAEQALWEHANKACDCGHLPTPTEHLGTGQARMTGTDDRTICYDCADAMTRCDIAQSKSGDRITLYISSDGNTVTTWTGGRMMRILGWGARHPWSNGYDGPRYYVRAIDNDGCVWYGTGANGMYANLRKAKG